MEDRVTDLLKHFRDKSEISVDQCKYLSPLGSRPETIYDLVKDRETVADGLPSFRPILSATNILTFKALVTMLEPLTTNECIIKDSFPFAKEVLILNL